MRVYYFLIAITLLSACSQSRPGRPSFGSGSANVDPTNGGGGGGSGGGEGGTGGGDTVDLSFNVVDSRSTVRISSFEVLVNKLKIVTSLDENSEAVKLARKSDQSLGAYDFAQGVLPENKWSLDKMGAWFKVIDQACRDTKLLDKIQKAGGDKEFLEAAYGRDILADETAMFKELKLTGARRARVLCTAVLTSGEFVSL